MQSPGSEPQPDQGDRGLARRGRDYRGAAHVCVRRAGQSDVHHEGREAGARSLDGSGGDGEDLDIERQPDSDPGRQRRL